jgi:uncharacterized membrane protein YqjE
MNNTTNTQERFPEPQIHRVTELLLEMKRELLDFVTTRVELFRSEVQETLAAIKSAAPLAVIAIVLMITAYLLLTLAVVGLIAVAFVGNPYAWFFAFLIAGGAWGLFGIIAAFLAMRSLRKLGFFPKKTIEVLKADKVWIDREVGSQA